MGVGTYEKILRPTQNPTLAGMDPLPLIICAAEYWTQSGGKEAFIKPHCRGELLGPFSRNEETVVGEYGREKDHGR